jgi:membrane protein implicated in regulation of membrane protease activity
MIPLGLLGQIYLVSMLVGGVFIGFNLMVGNLGEHGDGGSGGDGATSGGDDFSAGAAHGDAGGSADGVSSSGDDLGGADAANANAGKIWTPTMARATVFGGGHTSPTSMHAGPVPSITARIGGKILSLLSPMSIAIFLAFFGIVGFLCDQYLSWLGFFSLIPAVLVSMGISNLFKYCVRWLIVHGGVSTEAKVENMVGQIGEITVPIGSGRTGEITYVMGSKRYQAAARAISGDADIKKGTKVMIAEVRDHLVLVEPLAQSDLEQLIQMADTKTSEPRG